MNFLRHDEHFDNVFYSYSVALCPAHAAAHAGGQHQSYVPFRIVSVGRYVPLYHNTSLYCDTQPLASIMTLTAYCILILVLSPYFIRLEAKFQVKWQCMFIGIRSVHPYSTCWEELQLQQQLLKPLSCRCFDLLQRQRTAGCGLSITLPCKLRVSHSTSTGRRWSMPVDWCMVVLLLKLLAAIITHQHPSHLLRSDCPAPPCSRHSTTEYSIRAIFYCHYCHYSYRRYCEFGSSH